MTCPVCGTALERATLLAADDGHAELRGFRCPRGHGVFLPSDLYFEWREGHAPSAADGALPSAEDVGDVKRPKLCPQDGRIMGRYKVGGEGSFWLDRCGTCGGVWFDGDEWDATVAAGLLAELPAVVSDAWQRDVEAAEAADRREARLRERVGADDLERADAFRAWLWAHPERSLLLARLGTAPDA